MRCAPTACCTSTACPSTTTGQDSTLLELIIDSVGGAEALDGLGQVQLELTGSRFIEDEGVTPGEPAVPAGEFATTVSVDFEQAGLRLDIARTPTYFPQREPVILSFSEIVNGDVGYVEGIDNLFGAPDGADMLSDRWASTVKLQRLLNPHFMLKELLDDPSLAAEVGTADFEGTEHALLEVQDDVFPVTVWFDPAAAQVTRITTMENSHLRRDVELDVRYIDWQQSAVEVWFPGRVQLWIEGGLIHEETRSAITSNPGLDAATFELPAGSMAVLDPDEAERGTHTHQHNQAFLSIGLSSDGLQTAIAAEEIAPGVHFLGGSSHHSLVVEQDGGVVIFEAPLYRERCVAILEWIDSTLMAPVTHVVLSHHHADHTACARTMVAAGASLVVHETAETFFEGILAAPSTIEPDLLEQQPVENPEIIVVPTGGNVSLDDAANPIVVYELASTHAVDLVFPFVESAGIAFTVDVYSPGFPPLFPTGAQEVLDAFDTAEVTADVNMIVGGHGFGSSTVADLQLLASG